MNVSFITVFGVFLALAGFAEVAAAASTAN